MPVWIFIIGILMAGHTAFAEKSLRNQIGKIRITDDVTKALISEVEIMNDKDKAKFAEKIVREILILKLTCTMNGKKPKIVEITE